MATAGGVRVSAGLWMLYLVLAAGVIGRNPLVTAAAAAVIAVTVLRLHALLPFLERYSIAIGLTFLIIGLLVPLADERVAVRDVLAGLRGSAGLMAFLGGALSAYICGLGLALLQARPEIMFGLVFGTILGVTLLGGIPVGPLAAAGLTAVLLQLWRYAARGGGGM